MTSKKKSLILIVISVLLLILAVFWFSLGQYLLPFEKASFTQDYIEKSEGQINVTVPEVYELANIIIAVTDYGIEHPFRVYKEGAYYQEVMDHFSSYRDHPLISSLDFSDERFDRYIRFRENSFAYRFEEDSIVQDEIYNLVQIPNWFEKYRKEVEDFARVSNFRQFYSDHEDFYKEQSTTYLDRAPIDQMWAWLEERFPQDISSYKVVFSPLIGASHTTTKYQSNGFTEVVMFVSGPDYMSEAPDDIENLLLSRLIFTEIDHNYVNPVTEEHLGSVKQAFSNLDIWNQQNSYRSAKLTFNEYMTWSLAEIYMFEESSPEAFEHFTEVTNRTMIESRGFVRYDAFSDKLLDLYQNQGDQKSIPDLYPLILQWAESIQNQD